uniref:DNA repair metallo-beta-lactamase domain-containing protein n=1 Tax=Aegilops tauschii TaxID=37682 RepID=R7WF80_AEGTA
MAAAIAGDAETDLTLPISDDLDDNGFPASPPTAATTSSFADDFYRSGIDWSSLQAPPSHRRRPAAGTIETVCGPLVQKNLFQAWGIEKPAAGMAQKVCGPQVQKNLFQAWGIEKPPREEAAQGAPVGARASSSSPSPSPSGAWPGRKRRWGGSDENGASRKPVACPFYKKIPGTPFTVDAFRYVCPLELDTEYVIDGVKVTFLEANHCPGAALIHFRLSDGKTYLHTGDFRASKSMQLHPLLQTGRISLLYLDTTYCNPKYKSAHNLEIKHFLYNVYFANLIAVSDFHHRRMLLILLSGQLKGWTFSEAAGKELDLIKPSSRGRVTIYGVPYSEHSSFSELRDFLKFLRPQKVIPTVNVGNAANRDKMQAYFREWLKST